ncbi:MAG: heavy-metal-associated domain-containing protein [Rickettsiales bacterium]
MRTFLFFTLSCLLYTPPALAETITVSISGLACPSCATGVEKAFREQAAVGDVKIVPDKKLVLIGTRPKQTLDDAIVKKLITNAGYTVTKIERQ